MNEMEKEGLFVVTAGSGALGVTPVVGTIAVDTVKRVPYIDIGLCGEFKAKDFYTREEVYGKCITKVPRPEYRLHKEEPKTIDELDKGIRVDYYSILEKKNGEWVCPDWRG